jgi:Na+-driven multidrug efflux pump
MRGAGDVKAVMWLTWLTTYGVRLPLAYLLCGLDVTLPAWLGGAVILNPFHFDWGLPASAGGGLIGLWVGLCAELVMRGVVFAARFVHGGWLRARV